MKVFHTYANIDFKKNYFWALIFHKVYTLCVYHIVWKQIYIFWSRISGNMVRKVLQFLNFLKVWMTDCEFRHCNVIIASSRTFIKPTCRKIKSYKCPSYWLKIQEPYLRLTYAQDRLKLILTFLLRNMRLSHYLQHHVLMLILFPLTPQNKRLCHEQMLPTLILYFHKKKSHVNCFQKVKKEQKKSSRMLRCERF